MIYFAQSVDGGSIKIGHSDDVPTRLRQLESHYGQPLALLATMPGGYPEEQVVHSRFAHLRFGRTEQFRPAADLMAFIGRPLLVGANPEAVESMAPADDRVAAIVLKDTREYREWLSKISSDSLIPVASIVRDALKKWAADRGYPPPPDKS